MRWVELKYPFCRWHCVDRQLWSMPLATGLEMKLQLEPSSLNPETKGHNLTKEYTYLLKSLLLIKYLLIVYSIHYKIRP